MATNNFNEIETILIVDDSPENLTILSNLLKSKYKVKAASNGENAIKIVGSDSPPDLILLDIIMPGMNGYEVCKYLKKNPKTAEIPVLFTSSLSETADILKGFQAGAVDYITKPFQPEEVFARVNVHLELKRTKSEIQSFLSKTLIGSVRLLIEILTITQPQLVQQSNRIRSYAKSIISKLSLDANDAWSIELATMLSHIGCISIPSEVLRKVLAGHKLIGNEVTYYMQYPALGAKLIENIPRLEKTAAIIKHQLINPAELPFSENQVEYIGSVLLNMLISFDVFINNGTEIEYAYNKVKVQLKGCPDFLLKAFRGLIDEMSEASEKKVLVAELTPGMILAENAKLRDGTLLLSSGTELSDNLIDLMLRLSNQGLFAMKVILVSTRI